MDRNPERGQMILEMMILVLMFAGFFLVAVNVSQEGDRQQKQYRFSKTGSGRP